MIVPAISSGIEIDRKFPKSIDIKKVVRQLTIKYYQSNSDEVRYIRAYRFDGSSIILPRSFGRKYLKEVNLYREARGVELPKLEPIKLYDYQKPWVEQVVEKSKWEWDVLAKAATGKGKTVMSLEIIRRLGRSAIVIVDQKFLMDQWVDAAKKFLNIPESKIGIVQGTTLDFREKYITIAMIQTLYRKKYHKDFYNYFGTAVFDECHVVGAPVFSKVIFQFPAKFRLAVSATPERTDALNKIITYHFGNVAVVLEEQHKKSIVRYIEHNGCYSWYANISPKTGRFIAEVAKDSGRNLLICNAIKWLYDSGRVVLAVSDRIEHLEYLKSLCYYLGIPSKEMGVVAGYSLQFGYGKNPTPIRKPANLQKGAEYTPISLQLIKKRNPKKLLDEIKATKKIIFATYGMFSKGVDIPRLNAGIDCTPRSKAEQVHGRILRQNITKKIPIWVTIRDTNSFRSEYLFLHRLEEYYKSNAEIYLWRIGKGVKKRQLSLLKPKIQNRIQKLKSQKILMKLDGNYTVTTDDIENE